VICAILAVVGDEMLFNSFFGGSSVATGRHGGHVPPNPSPAESWELPKSDEKNWKWGYRIIVAKQIRLKYVV